MKSYTLIFILMFSFCASGPSNAEPEWTPLKADLWKNAKGDIALRDISSCPELSVNFIDHFDFGGEQQLRTVIDIDSFQKLNGSFYKDKNRIYQYYAMACGGRFSKFEEVEPKVDYASFSVINEFYAKDKKHIYEHRNGMIDGANVATFVTSKKYEFIARDKNHYYAWGDIMTAQEIEAFENDVHQKITEYFD